VHFSTPSLDAVDARYRALADVAGSLASHRDLADLLLSLRAQLEPLVEFTFLVVSLWDQETDTIHVRFFEPLGHPSAALVGGSYPAAGTYPGQVVHSARPVNISPVRADGPYPSPVLSSHGVQSYCAVPLATARGVLGSLNFGSLRPDAYGPDDVDLMVRVATIVAVAVENTMSLETIQAQRATLQHERDQLNVLLDVTNAVVTQLDTCSLFASVAPAIQRCCSADFLSMSLFDEGTRVLRKHVCSAKSTLTPAPAVEVPVDASLSGGVFRSGRPRIFTRQDLLEWPDLRPLTDAGVQSACVVPLVSPQGTIGTLELASLTPDAFSSALFGLLMRIGGQIAIAVSNAMAYERIEALNAQLAREKLYLQDEIRNEHLFEDIVGRSPALRQVLREVTTVAPTDSTVLIFGETGSGKELVARAVHQLSGRQDQAFVKLNCAAIPTGLLESELFGHEKGAFTGAINSRIGRFELASRGTVFLDEVGEIPLELQPKLLRVLQEREFERLGSTRTLRTDARLLAATNRDLSVLVDEGKFRADLFYRLNVFPVRVPPLRDRREDIPMLVRHFAEQFGRRMKKRIETIAPDTMDALTRYDWPGNIRELQNLIERAVILSPGPTLNVPLSALQARVPAPARAGEVGTLEESDRRHILAALEASNWVVSGPNGAAARLGLKRSTLQFRMRKLGIEKRR
jgi:formate hydrogenlyase transcriptional activator